MRRTRGGCAALLHIDAKEFTTSRDVAVVDDFSKMGLNEQLLRGIYAYGARIVIAFLPTARRGGGLTDTSTCV